MKHKLEYINSELKEIKKYNLYRKMHDSKITGAYITVNSKTLINLCSNDYLGIVQPKISNKQNQSSSRLVSGNDNSFRILEEKIGKAQITGKFVNFSNWIYGKSWCNINTSWKKRSCVK